MLHNLKKKFLVLTSPRSGSNLLCSIISSHPKVHYLGEYYPAPEEINFVESALGNNPAGTHHGNLNTTMSNGCWIFSKMFYYWYIFKDDTSEGFRARWDLLHYMKANKICVINLRRWNLLDMTLSLALANRENNYIEKPYKGGIELEAKQLEYLFFKTKWECESMSKALLYSGIKHITIWYEEMINDHQGIANRINDFQGRNRHYATIPWYVRKQREGSQRENILNYDSLKSHFRGSIYEEYFMD